MVRTHRLPYCWRVFGLAAGLAAAPVAAWAVPSVPASPAMDVYAILAANPGLAASVPLYTQAQEAGRFTSLTVIGDSYGDQGNALTYNPVSGLVGADGRYGNALNIIDAVQYHYALSDSAVINYAFGGASSGSVNNNPPALQLPGFAQEVAALVASGRTFGASDLISFTTAGVGGANDPAVGLSVAQSVSNIVGYVNTLTGLGAKNILLSAPTTVELQAALAPFAAGGTNIYLVNQTDVLTPILANPTAFGFAANATSIDYCSQFGGTHACNSGLGNRTAIQTTGQILAEDQFLYFYQHPTTALAAQIAEAEIVALDTPVPEPGSVAILAAGLLGLLGWRKTRCEVYFLK